MNDWLLIFILLVLLLMIFMGVMFLYLLKISSSLRRLETRLQRIDLRVIDTEKCENTEKSEWENPAEAENSAFDRFLTEDVSRRALPKREQFEAYRRWRQENGLNWSGH